MTRSLDRIKAMQEVTNEEFGQVEDITYEVFRLVKDISDGVFG